MKRRFGPAALTLPLVLLLGAAGSPLHAQVLRGHLTNAVGGAEGGAIVLALDSTGTVRGRTLSGTAGGYTIMLSLPGRYHLRVLRVGYPAWESAVVRLGESELAQVDGKLPSVPIVVQAVTVAGKSCEVRPAEGDAAATLLEEGRKAVTSADELLREGGYRFKVRRHTRHLDRSGSLITDDSTGEIESSTWPISSLPVSELERGGFVQVMDPDMGPTYYGPDAQVLFSDFFLGNHCFFVSRTRPVDSGLVALRFQVVQSRKLADLEGALWLDPTNLHLSHLDFQYTPLPDWAPKGSASGRLDFIQLPSSIWIVRRWSLRVPQPERTQGTNIYSLHGYVEQTGEVTGVRTKTGEVVLGE
ncbi:MAG: carboxypeptidase-like regulatory domain-containing protein [Gemmatimonadales bacterium]